MSFGGAKQNTTKKKQKRKGYDRFLAKKNRM